MENDIKIKKLKALNSDLDLLYSVSVMQSKWENKYLNFIVI